jgi:hypothetical protein
LGVGSGAARGMDKEHGSWTMASRQLADAHTSQEVGTLQSVLDGGCSARGWSSEPIEVVRAETGPGDRRIGKAVGAS